MVADCFSFVLIREEIDMELPLTMYQQILCIRSLTSSAFQIHRQRSGRLVVEGGRGSESTGSGNWKGARRGLRGRKSPKAASQDSAKREYPVSARKRGLEIRMRDNTRRISANDSQSKKSGQTKRSTVGKRVCSMLTCLKCTFGILLCRRFFLTITRFGSPPM